MFYASSIKVIILDFDGVVVESNDIKDRVFRKIFNRFPEHSEDLWQYHKKYMSVSRYDKFDYVLKQTGRSGDIDFKNSLLTEFSESTLSLMRTVPFVQGAQDFLNELQGKIPLYLASVTPANDLEIILNALQIHSIFKKVYGCPPWNKSAAIKDILEREQQTPDRAVLIGDSYGDQRAAKETGIHFIGRDSGLGFEEPYPDHVIPNLTGLAERFTNTY
jgi:phosphoglycolate phosphatase-like HAD superfamily hydrolase